MSQLQKEYNEILPKLTQTKQSLTLSLEKLFEEKQLKIHSIKSRIKSYSSFEEKVKRKKYAKPFQRCEDLLGLRIVCLVSEQIEQVIAHIKSEFTVKKVETKKQRIDQFAYTAHHLIITYESITCEIQIRTILQDAWSEMEHYFNYKHIGVDEILLRKLHALAALLEIADDQFTDIYTAYQNRQSNNSTKDEILTPIRLYHYSKKEFPWASEKYFPEIENLQNYEDLCELAQKQGIKTTLQLKEKFQLNKQSIYAQEEFRVKEILNSPNQWPQLYQKVKQTNHFYSPLTIIKKIIEN